MKMDYRDEIEKIIERETESANENLTAAILAGAPDRIDKTEAIEIASWLKNEATAAWNLNGREKDKIDWIAKQICALVHKKK